MPEHTPGWVWTTLKWTAAVAVLSFIAVGALFQAAQDLREAIMLDGEDEPEPEVDAEPAGPPDLRSGAQQALDAAGMRGGVVEGAQAGALTIGPRAADFMLVAFEPLPYDPACLHSLTLESWVVTGTPTDVAVRPAHVPDLDELTDGALLANDVHVEEVEPALASTDGGASWLRWDVAAVYPLALAHPTEHVAVALSLPAGAARSAHVALSTGLDDPHRPRLAWAVMQDCVELDAVAGRG